MGMTADATTGALNVVDYEHHEIHQGSHFFVVDAVDQAINTVFDLQVTTPNTRVWAHIVWEITAENEHNFYIYEDVNIINAGTAVTIFNSNRNSTKTSGLVIKSQVNASIGDANADTAVAAATELEHGMFSGRNLAGGASRDSELVLKQGTDYCFRGFFTAAGYLSFNLQWYEHTNKAEVTGLPWSG